MKNEERLKRGTDIFKVPFEMIVCETSRNGRIDYGDIEELALSIFENGQKQPIRATKIRDESPQGYHFDVVDGFRRYCAVSYIRDILKKDFPEMLVIGTGAKYTQTDAFYEQIVSNQSKPFNMLEEGNVYVALKAKNEKESAIAKKVGKSVQHIYNCLSLASLPPELKKFVIDGAVKPTLMLELCKQYTDFDELTQIIGARLEDKLEQTDTKQSVLPFEVTDGVIDIESQYDTPRKKCKLTAKDFEPSEKDVDAEKKPKKEKDYSFLDTDTAPSRDAIKKAVEGVDTPIVRLETLKNRLISDGVETTSALVFINLMDLIQKEASDDEILELFI